jgi:phage gpG-like protein
MGVKITRRPPDYAKRLGAGLAPVMRKTAMYLQSSADRKINSGVGPANASLTQEVKGGGRTLRDRNELAQSIAPHSGDLWADAGTNLRYARIQQEGGTVTPKNARALFISAGAKTRTLMRSYGASTPRSLINAMKADNYGFFSAGRVFFAYKKGGTLKSGKTGKDGKEFVLFIISHSVKVPARPFLFIDEQDESYLLKLIQGGVMGALGGNP